MKCFYLRVTKVNNFTSIGLVGVADDLAQFSNRVRRIFPEDEFKIDDAHQLAPLEVRCVHPECKGELTEDCESLMVTLDNPLLI